MGVFSNIYIDSVSTDESNGLFSVKSVLSLELSRQELGANIECRVETPALEHVVSNHIHIDLQGMQRQYNKNRINLLTEFIIAFSYIFSNFKYIYFLVRPTKVDLSGVKDHTVQGSNILLQCLVSLI